MTRIPLSTPAGHPITSLDSWTRPKSGYHWKPGRSAMELARAWFRGAESCCPEELRALFDSHPDTRNLVLLDGRPEHVTPLPERGEGRNHDLWLRGRTTMTKVTVCIEAKADEPFGERLGKQLVTARKRQPNTGAPERARALLKLLFGRACNPEALPWRELRYQLITAAAGAVLQAEIDESGAAVLVIHEFLSDACSAERLAANQADLEAFLELLAPGSEKPAAGKLVGPILLPESERVPQGMQLYVGKVVTEVGAG